MTTLFLSVSPSKSNELNSIWSVIRFYLKVHNGQRTGNGFEAFLTKTAKWDLDAEKLSMSER
jgi:hypothetical protein